MNKIFYFLKRIKKQLKIKIKGLGGIKNKKKENRKWNKLENKTNLKGACI